MPEDFGLIGMLSIFIAISQSLIDSGMGSGLIQKKNRTDTDFSTVFVFNFIVSLIIYLILYFSAPLISAFYEIPQLITLTRILTLNIIINSISIVQRSKLTINLDFKTIAKVNIISVFTGGITGIYFAFKGLGVWALVIQNLSVAFVSVIMFFILSKWIPSIRFSRESFKNLFGFGSKLLIAGLYAQTIQNIYNITIGKVYAASELGYYTRSRQFAELTAGTVSSILQQVSYPILASLQDDRKKMSEIFRKLIRTSSFLIFPSMTLLAILAEPFIQLFLTDKWLPAVPLLQWLCFARIFYPINAINMNILNAIGRSDLFLKVDLIKFPVIATALVITIPLGLKAIVIGHVITSIIAFFINAYLPGKYFSYGGFSQLKDMLPGMIATLVMAIVVVIFTHLLDSLWLKIIIGSISGFLVYLFVAFLMQINEIKEIRDLIKNSLSGHFN